MSDKLVPINNELSEYVKQGYHLPGVTVITMLADFMRPSVRIVRINPDIKANEVYPVGGGKMGLGRIAIQKFADAGRIELKIRDTRVEKGSGTESYIAKVSGERYELDGSPKRIEDEKRYDLVAREEALRVKYENDAKKEHPDWNAQKRADSVEHAVKKVMGEKRMFAMECAVTGAQARVVEKLLGIKPAYTYEELKKPFVIVSVTPVVDLKDPSIKKMVTAHMLGITDVLFQTAAGIEYSSTRYVPPLPAPEVIEAETVSKAPALVPHMCVEDFEAYPRVIQEEILTRILGNNGNHAIQKRTDGEIVSLYRDIIAKAA